jgi:hypothetical protein
MSNRPAVAATPSDEGHGAARWRANKCAPADWVRIRRLRCDLIGYHEPDGYCWTLLAFSRFPRVISPPSRNARGPCRVSRRVEGLIGEFQANAPAEVLVPLRLPSLDLLFELAPRSAAPALLGEEPAPGRPPRARTSPASSRTPVRQPRASRAARAQVCLPWRESWDV